MPPEPCLEGAEPPEPVWLTEREQAAWLALGALVIRLPSAMDADLQSSSGLSLFEYLVLSQLSQAPGRRMRMSELGATVSASPSRLSHGVARLERHGWVCRAPLPGDGRQIIASLTDTGFGKVVASAPAHVRFVRTLVVDVLTEDQLHDLHVIADTVLASIDTTMGSARGTRPGSAC